MTIEHKNTEGEGPYKVTLTLDNGKRETHRHTYPDMPHLMHLLDHCEIKGFSVALDD